ncbi:MULTISPECIES: hypothetical protein [Pseudoalteromonas]|uniref:hypothetical protein n=1 Tax=Pseudoalteromonas TaxID=53246 RepID=UPI00158153D0|nr:MULTISPECIES: hypothetical protein [Pseudoalteromonas]MDI4650523.1 hypothetical protein [Pseudoalteromonas shioyasakiensis]NUJ36942.1 hypothetical protein [Pseudoalteromonas sp. 0303]
MTGWIDSKNILKWVKEDNEDLRNWLAYRFSSYAEYFKSENASLNSFIRYEVKRYSSNEDTQKVEVQRLHKAWKSYERGLKNTSNKVCKLQLEVSKSARDKLKVLSDADEISQSKYIEKLINYARKNPKLISKDTKVQEPYKHKQRTFDDSLDYKAIRENLSTIDAKVTRLLNAWED